VITQSLLGGILTPYTIILSISAAAGLAISYWLAKEEGSFLLDAGLGILLASLLGARAGFVLINLSYFLNNPGEIPQLWLGGLTWPGALLGAAAALVLVHLVWKHSLGELCDSYLPLFGLLSITVWFTGWGAGIGYGPVVNAWFGIPVRDSLGLLAKRWPLPILGGVLTGAWIAGAMLFPLPRWRKPGSRSVIAVGGLGGINLLLSMFRVDPSPSLLGVRLESWFSLLLLLAAGAFLFCTKGKNQ
jgi:prolipoprotein diacylglyceryltransferase